MAACQQQIWQEGKQQQHLQHGGYDDLSSVYRGAVVLPRRQDGLAPEPPPPPQPSSSLGRSAAAQATAMRIHSEAERRRRERINAHLATLRRILPDAKQMDKATLLASVVNQVKHLKTRATEATTPSTAATVPPEANEVTVQCYAGGEHTAAARTYVRATVSCDDRPGLLADIAAAFRRLRLRPLSADMSCLGGRTRHAFVLCREEEEDAAAEARPLKEAVRQALAKVALPETVYGGGRSKRQRLMMESRYSTAVMHTHMDPPYCWCSSRS
uniref:BHLH domain-containing protein n=1 Tax=Oryza meridionalis TaxID=40149 RepID=A0A0E0DMJ5_9ORYZ